MITHHLLRTRRALAPAIEDDIWFVSLSTDPERDTPEAMKKFAERQGVVLIELVPDDLPPIRGDEERLHQLLMNLLHNAIKFSPEGGTVTVTEASQSFVAPSCVVRAAKA